MTPLIRLLFTLYWSTSKHISTLFIRGNALWGISMINVQFYRLTS